MARGGVHAWGLVGVGSCLVFGVPSLAKWHAHAHQPWWVRPGLAAGVVFILAGLVLLLWPHPRSAALGKDERGSREIGLLGRSTTYDLEDSQDIQLEGDVSSADRFLRARRVKGIREKGTRHEPRQQKTEDETGEGSGG